jgi:hypothetical protein
VHGQSKYGITNKLGWGCDNEFHGFIISVMWNLLNGLLITREILVYFSEAVVSLQLLEILMALALKMQPRELI